MVIRPEYTDRERRALADEIERRRLKFADVVAMQYEMLSENEHDMILEALRERRGR